MGRQAILEWMAECIPQVHLLSVSSCTQFWFVTAVPKCLNSDTLSKDLLCICPAFCSWYTGCNRRNVQDFGRVFLRSNYTDITQNTYIQSWTVMEIMAIEMCGLLGCRRTVRLSDVIPVQCACPARDMVMQWPWRVRYSQLRPAVKYLEV